MAENNNNKPQVRVASIEVELGMSVRDDNYVQATGEIYLTEPELESFLHQFRHHLQNIERRYERRGLTSEGAWRDFWRVPYKDCIYRMYGEDDAIAWSKFVIEVAVDK